MQKIFFTGCVLALVLLSCIRDESGKNLVRTKEGFQEIRVDSLGDTVLYRYNKAKKLISTAGFLNGYYDGEAINYFDNGKVETILHYKKGYKNGLVKSFFRSGKLYRETHYKMGKKEGIRKVYYETGELKAEIPYKHNQLQPGTKEYSKAGKRFLSKKKIEITTKDKLAFENTYYLVIKVVPFNKNTRYSLFKKVDGDYLEFKLDYFKKAGVINYPIKVMPGMSVMETLIFRAKTKSIRGIPIILTRTYHLAVENRNRF